VFQDVMSPAQVLFTTPLRTHAPPQAGVSLRSSAIFFVKARAYLDNVADIRSNYRGGVRIRF
jgi:hypothetical protein